jgi:hypothetical protein
MTDTYTAPVLAELEARAGASDRDREAWLAERRAGITATEVRDLAIGTIRQQDLIDLKLGRKVDDFTGNAYTEWGKQRESIIAAELAGEGFAEETRVFHHPENSRYLASPDGLRIDFDEQLDVLEIKTSKIDQPPGSAEEQAKGYALQVQWVMFVTGARRGRYVVEERLGAPWNFTPGDLNRHWIERDDTVIGALRVIADEFLAELDRQREDGAPEIDEEVDTHAVNYLRGLAAEKEGKALKEASYLALIQAGVSQTSALAKVTYSPGAAASEFEEDVIDLEAAEAAHPRETAALARAKKRVEKLQAEWDALAAAHMKKVTSTRPGKRARVTVTAVKEKKA